MMGGEWRRRFDPLCPVDRAKPATLLANQTTDAAANAVAGRLRRATGAGRKIVRSIT
jgi:hypothetical protein